jgi:TolA-binding protein
MFGGNDNQAREMAANNFSRIQDLQIEIAKLKTHINSLRGLINKRRMKELDRIEETEELKSPDGLDGLRVK